MDNSYKQFLEGLRGKIFNSKYYIWFDPIYCQDWGYFKTNTNVGEVLFTHVTSDKNPPENYPNALCKGYFRDPQSAIRYAGAFTEYGFGVDIPPDPEYWDSLGK